jgi:hypothetical protein
MASSSVGLGRKALLPLLRVEAAGVTALMFFLGSSVRGASGSCVRVEREGRGGGLVRFGRARRNASGEKQLLWKSETRSAGDETP